MPRGKIFSGTDSHIQIKCRVPEDLYKFIRSEADRNIHTLSKEVVNRLTLSMHADKTEERLRRIIKDELASIREEALMSRYAEEVGRV